MNVASSLSWRPAVAISAVSISLAVTLAAPVARPAAAADEYWSAQFGTTRHDRIWGIATDWHGVTVSGYTDGALEGASAGRLDAFVRRYDYDGRLVWTRQFGTSADDAVTGITADEGGLTVAGYTGGSLEGASAGGVDAFVRRFDFEGTVIWTRQFGTTGFDAAAAVEVDERGTVVVTGETAGALGGLSAGRSDAFVRVFRLNGDHHWTRQFGGAYDDIPTGVALDGEAITVSGTVRGYPPSGGTWVEDGFVRRFDLEATELWARQIATAANDGATGVTTDATGVTVIGYTGGNVGGPNQGASDAFVRRYDLAGATQWTRQFGSGANDSIEDVAADGAGVTAVGWTGGSLTGLSAGSADTIVRHYDLAGAVQWTRQFGTSANDFGTRIALDAHGGLTVGGYTGGSLGGDPAGSDDGFLRRYVALDQVPPTGTIAIDGGASATRSTTVEISLDGADDDGSRGLHVRFSNNGAAWSAWQATAEPTATWDLAHAATGGSSAQGTKTVHAQWIDAAGNISSTATDTILYETGVPAGTVSVESGASTTTTANVTLALAASDPTPASGVAEVRFSNDGTAWSAWEASAATKAWNLANPDAGGSWTNGTRTVHVQWRDAAGNASVVATDSILYASPAPAGTTTINGGAAYTRSTSVSVAAPATRGDAPVTHVRMSNSGSVSDGRLLVASDVPYTTPVTWNLADEATGGTSVEGANKVFVQWRDAAGHYSAVASDAIVLDTVAPSSATVATLPVVQTATGFTVRWSASDATSRVMNYDVRYRKAAWNASLGTSYVPWKPALAATSAAFTGAPGNTYCFSVKARDHAGNVSPAWSAEKCTVVPLDDRSLTASTGWTRVTATGHYLNTYTRSTTLNRSLTRTSVKGRQISLVATKCATCGTVKVYWNNVLRTTKSLAASTTLRKQVIPLLSFTSPQSGTLKIVVSTSGKPVYVDGLGIRA